MENQIQTAQQGASTLKRFNACIASEQTQNYLQQVLHERKSSFVNNITALVSNSANLQECVPMSLVYAGLKATALDLPLDPNLGFAYVIPFKNNKKGVTEAQFQIGYKGFIQLAIRSGQFLLINVTDIREGELKGEDILTGEMSFSRVPDRESKPVVGYAAFFRLTNGFSKTMYMTVGEVKAHAGRYSQTYSSKNEYIRKASKWATDFDAMAKKTVLKLLLSKYAPLSVEMQNAIQNDQAVIDDQGEAQYLDNPEEQQPTVEDIQEAVEAHKEEMRQNEGQAPKLL